MVKQNEDFTSPQGGQLESKSERKRQMLALQKIGETLVGLSAAELSTIPLDTVILEAVQQAKTFTSHGALRRQLQYIGKLMRHTDAAPITAALDKLKNQYRQHTVQLHQSEQWRDRFIHEGTEALTAFINQYPDVDHQQLHQLIRHVQKDKESNKNTGASTALFRYLRDIISK